MGGRVSYWKLRRQKAKDSHLVEHCLERQKHLGINDSGSQDLDYINANLRLAWKGLHSTQNIAGDLMKTRLEEVATCGGG